jgi:hypothetical protein
MWIEGYNTTPWKFYKILELNAISSCLVLTQIWNGGISKIPSLAGFGFWNGLTRREGKMQTRKVKAEWASL